MRGKIDVGEWISILRSRAKAAGFHFSEIIEDDHVKFVMKHDMGMKWSIYFQTYYYSAFKTLGASIECSLTNNAISYQISTKDYDPKKPKAYMYIPESACLCSLYFSDIS